MILNLMPTAWADGLSGAGRRPMHCVRLIFAALVLAFAAAPDVSAAQTLRRGNGAEPGSLDPHRIDTAWEIEIVNDLFLGLTTPDARAEPVPGAAESWTTSADGLIWTFTLRAGLRWSDGTPLTAEDFVYAFRRLLDPKTAAKYASIQYVIKNAAAVNSGKLPVGRLGVRAPDARTFEITLESPTPFLPGLLTHITALPVPEHVIRQHGETWIKPGTMVSNGAYVLEANSPHDFIKLKKNPQFYDAANVAIDKVIFYPIEDATVALTRFRARELDLNVTTGGFPVEQLEWLNKNMPGQARIAPGLLVSYIVLNMRKAPFDDGRVRRALSLCLDRDILAAKVARDQSRPAYAFVPPGIANYGNTARLDFAGRTMSARVIEAKRLLADAGYSADKPLTVEHLYMNSQSARRGAVAQAAMLKGCGIVLRLIANEPKVHYRTIQESDFVMASAAWGADYNDPQTFLYLLDSRSLGFNYGGYHNPKFDGLLDQARGEQDLARRAAILAQAEQIALDDNAIVPLLFPTTRTLVAPQVQGYVDNPSNAHPTRWMRLESK